MSNRTRPPAPAPVPVIERSVIIKRVRAAVIANPEQFGLADFGIVAPLESILAFVCGDGVLLGDVWRALVSHGLASGWRDNGGEPFMAITALGSFQPDVCDRMHNFTCRPVDEIVVKRAPVDGRGI